MCVPARRAHEKALETARLPDRLLCDLGASTPALSGSEQNSTRQVSIRAPRPGPGMTQAASAHQRAAVQWTAKHGGVRSASTPGVTISRPIPLNEKTEQQYRGGETPKLDQTATGVQQLGEFGGANSSGASFPLRQVLSRTAAAHGSTAPRQAGSTAAGGGA